MSNDDCLNSIFTEVKTLGFVCNQYDFSAMCGRTPAWFSAIKARQLPMTADAFLTLSFNIRRKAKTIIDVKTHSAAMKLCDRLLEEAQNRAGEKAARIFSYGLD